jgi:POT family proton-dependent oligopeptide transporter
VGTVVYGTSSSVYVVFLGVILFSLGEMLTGPKKTEYFSLIAPKGKKALYLGYVNIPVALGQFLGATIAGRYYGKNGEKAALSLRYLVEKTDYMAKTHPEAGAWDGNVASLEKLTGIGRKDAFNTLVKFTGDDAKHMNDVLWNEYHPYTIWYIFAAIGFASLIGMLVYARMSRRWKEMDV